MAITAITAVALGLLAPTAGAGGAFTITVEPGGDDVFAPDEAQIELGEETFVFNWEDPPTDDGHNVVHDDGLFNSGPPSLDQADFPVEASAGTFDYYCVVHADPHSAGGMDGKLAVSPILSPEPPLPEGTFRAAWANDLTETGGAFDVRFKVGGGNWRSWKNDTTMFSALFGKNGAPVEVNPGQTYRIQARSEKSSNHARRSRWSPPLVVGLPPR